MDNDFCNNYGYLEIFGGIYLWKFPLLTKRVRGRIETFSMSDYRDITYINQVPVNVIHHPSEIYDFFSRKLQRLIVELEEDVVDRELTILDHANENLRRKEK